VCAKPKKLTKNRIIPKLITLLVIAVNVITLQLAAIKRIAIQADVIPAAPIFIITTAATLQKSKSAVNILSGLSASHPAHLSN